MAKDKKPRGSEAKLAFLQSLRDQPVTPQTLAELRRHLADRSFLVVAETAKLLKEQGVAGLNRELAEAFDRFLIDAEESDPHARAKIEIAEALNRLEFPEPEVFLRGLKHRQDSRFGDPTQDAAGALRAHSAIGLARINHPGVVLLLTELLLDTDNTARAGAARALGGTGSLAAIPLLRYKVRCGDALVDVLGECFASLLILAFDESLPFVAEYLRSRDEDVQATVMFALAESRRPRAFNVLRDYWPKAPADLHEPLLAAFAMFRLPAANDFLYSLIATQHPSASQALSSLAIHKHNPKIAAEIAAAVEANGTEPIRQTFRRKFHPVAS